MSITLKIFERKEMLLDAYTYFGGNIVFSFDEI